MTAGSPICAPWPAIEISVNRRLPAEFEPQSGTLLTWPHDSSHWGDQLDKVEEVFIEIIRLLGDHQKVIIVADNEACRDHVNDLLTAAHIPCENIEVYVTPCNDCWARDHGPVTVIEGDDPVLLDFTFNGWNRKYPFQRDNAITGSLSGLGAFRQSKVHSMAYVLEGGAIETNGQGCLLTTASCLLDNNRNPDQDQAGYETLFAQHFGCRETIWLQHGQLAGDDTDGHIDTLARFADASTLIYQTCDDPDHVDYPALDRMQRQLVSMNDQRDKPLQLVPVPMPVKHFADDGSPLPASYANFIISNRKVLVPAYDDKNDETANAIIAGCFPDREVISINALPLIRQCGSLHCTAMHLPAGVLA